HVTGDGTIASGWPADGLPVEATSANSTPPAIAVDGSGGVLVAWSSGFEADRSYLPYVERYDASGAVAPGWRSGGVPACQTPGLGPLGGVIADYNGGAYVGWVDYRTAPPDADPPYSYADIYCQHVTADGAIVPGWPAEGLPVCTQPDIQWTLRMSEDGQ